MADHKSSIPFTTELVKAARSMGRAHNHTTHNLASRSLVHCGMKIQFLQVPFVCVSRIESEGLAKPPSN